MGCAENKGVRSLDGAAAAFEAPPYAVKGATAYDQRWIDGQVEAGVAAFNWPRPQPRPAALDAPKVANHAAPVPLPKKKPPVWKRWWPDRK